MDPPRNVLLVSDPTTAWIAKRILDARSELGWTQSALAERLNRTQTAVSYWESAKRKPGLDDVIDLARTLGRDVDYFLPPERTRQPVAAVLRAQVARLGSDELKDALDAVIEHTEPGDWPPREINVGARQPAYAANELLERAGITEPPVPVDELVGRCGVRLDRLDFPDALSGLVIEAEDGAIIAVNGTMSKPGSASRLPMSSGTIYSGTLIASTSTSPTEPPAPSTTERNAPPTISPPTSSCPAA